MKQIKQINRNKNLNLAAVPAFVSLILMLLLSMPAFAQFGNPMSGPAEPDIDAVVKYEEGMIIFKFDLEADHHITDLKNGFFTVELDKNDSLEIIGRVFPKGIPYDEEMVYKGEFDVKVYVKSLKEIIGPVKLTFKLGYQICQEHPQEVCFPPDEMEVDVTIEKSFKEVKIEKQATPQTTLKDLSSQGSAIAYQPKGGDWVMLALLALVLLALSIGLGLTKIATDEDGGMGTKFSRTVAVFLLIIGSFLFIRALDIKYYPEKYSMKPRNIVTPNWVHGIEEGRTIALKQGKKMLVDTSAEWCVACKELEEYTFSDAEVAKALETYVMVKVDFTKQTEENEALRKKLGVIGMPTVIFYDEKGAEVKRFSGFKNKKEFLSFIGSSGGWFDRMTGLLKEELDKKSLLVFGLIFFLGFLTSLTPCVYPVIPIVMGYIGTRSGNKKLKGLYLSIFFVLGLAIVYSVLGVVAAMSGSMMGATFQKPAVVIAISAIFVIMGLSLAGLFEIPIPSSISSKAQSGGGKSEVIGALIVGGVSGIIAAPCVGPVLLALLSWISQTKDIFLGFLLTFIFSLGMGIIFLIVGTFSGVVTAMPKGGKWMDYIKYFFAILLIAGGIYIVNAIVPVWLNLLLWGFFLIAVSIFIGLIKVLEEYNLKSKVYKFVVLLIFLLGLFMFSKSLEIKFFTKDTAKAPVALAEVEPNT